MKNKNEVMKNNTVEHLALGHVVLKGVLKKVSFMGTPSSALRVSFPKKKHFFTTPLPRFAVLSPQGGQNKWHGTLSTTRREVNGGFTLIELLVVVLIIGILAAVALPQYKKAVATTRFAQALPVLRSLAEANERFYLANGYYTTNWDELDISRPITIPWEINYQLYDGEICTSWAAKYELPYLCIHYKHGNLRRPGHFVCNGYDTAFAAKLCAKYGEPIFSWTPHYTSW